MEKLLVAAAIAGDFQMESQNQFRSYYITVFVITILLFLWDLKRTYSMYARKRRCTQPVRAVISAKREIRHLHFSEYVYTFSGLDEYAGVTFYNRSARIRCEYMEDAEVELYVNPDRTREFWFEEEDMPGIFRVILSFFCIGLCLYTIIQLL